MTSEKQLLANRLNARRSTGPRTIRGKLRSRRNAVRHGLTAGTVVDVFEDDAEFRTFCRNVESAYTPRSAIDHELIHRLAALLWRLRRAHAVETGLFSIQGKLQRDLRLSVEHAQSNMFSLLGLEGVLSPDANPGLFRERQRTEAKARAFLRLCNINGTALDRLTRYEVSLWRQATQVRLLLERISASILLSTNRKQLDCETKPIPCR